MKTKKKPVKKVEVHNPNEFTQSIMCIIREHLPVILKYNPHLYQVILSSIDLAILGMSKDPSGLNKQFALIPNINDDPRYRNGSQSNQQDNPVNRVELTPETKLEIEDIISKVKEDLGK